MLEFFSIGLMVCLSFIVLSGLIALFVYGMVKLLLWLDDGSYYLYSVYKDKAIYGQFVTLHHE